MITYDQLAAAIRDEFLRMKGRDWPNLSERQKDKFFTRLGFAHEALRRAGLIETVKTQNTTEP
jgi:hypothetical protein